MPRKNYKQSLTQVVMVLVLLAVAMTAATMAVAQEAPGAAPAAPKIDSGDTAWMLTSVALVLMMTIPGLALFYGGMVQKRNVLDTVMQSFAIVGVVTVLWTVINYSTAFRAGTPFIGGLDRLFLQGIVSDVAKNAGSTNPLAPTIPETVYLCFQMTFAIITPALICGAFAERMKFSAMLWFMGLWTTLVYAPIAHWVWGPDGIFNSSNDKAWIHVLDFAGGTVVHINSGVAALVCALVLGKRHGLGSEHMAPHNLVLTMVGAALLWVGWFGFNAGSAVSAGVQAGMAMTVTQIATATAALAWMFAEWGLKGKPSLLGICSGAVAGLVAITPASGFVGPVGALVIGTAAGVGCYWGAVWLKPRCGYDDALDVFGVHAVGGMIGALLTGVFAIKEYGGTSGLIEGNAVQVLYQAIGIIVVIAYDLVVTLLILKVLDVVIGLRVSAENEREGLDLTLHGEVVP